MTSTLKTSRFAPLLVLALGTGIGAAGCATDSPSSGGDNGGSDNGGSNGGNNNGGDNGGSGSAAPALDASGKYAMQSQFDLATNVPGTVGTIVNAIIDATDSPDDPTHWLLAQIVNQLPNGTAKSLLQGAIPFVSGFLNDRLLDWAPNFVTTMVQVGNHFGDITKHFGLDETLEVTKSGTDGQYAGTRTSIGARFKIDTQTFDLAFADYHVANVVVPNIGIQLDATGKLTIGSHALALPYGGILHLGLDAAIIPLVDPAAHDLKELLADTIDCAAVGAYIDDALRANFGFGPGATVLETACHAGLNAGANAIYAKIDAVSATALELDIDGTARGADANHDHKVDALQIGKWEGTIEVRGHAGAARSRDVHRRADVSRRSDASARAGHVTITGLPTNSP